MRHLPERVSATRPVAGSEIARDRLLIGVEDVDREAAILLDVTAALRLGDHAHEHERRVERQRREGVCRHPIGMLFAPGGDDGYARSEGADRRSEVGAGELGHASCDPGLAAALALHATTDHLVEVRGELHRLCDQVAKGVAFQRQQLGVGLGAYRGVPRLIAHDRHLSE